MTHLRSVAVAAICFNPHTHAGCDSARNDDSAAIARFNPHTHAGCDDDSSSLRHIFFVSIHTPTQGVTHLMIPLLLDLCFNPHTHAGCDPCQFVQPSTYSVGFNPHTHAGCDVCISCCTYVGLVSIHTPTQGVT